MTAQASTFFECQNLFAIESRRVSMICFSSRRQCPPRMQVFRGRALPPRCHLTGPWGHFGEVVRTA